jgi:hypothetical protein
MRSLDDDRLSFLPDSDNLGLILGLSLGIGIPVVLGVIGGLVYYFKFYRPDGRIEVATGKSSTPVGETKDIPLSQRKPQPRGSPSPRRP